MYFVYCLYSPFFRKTYVGRTSNIAGRLVAHNHPSNTGYTKRFQPWELVFTEEFRTIKEATTREKFYKTGNGRELIKQKLMLL